MKTRYRFDIRRVRIGWRGTVSPEVERATYVVHVYSKDGKTATLYAGDSILQNTGWGPNQVEKTIPETWHNWEPDSMAPTYRAWRPTRRWATEAVRGKLCREEARAERKREKIRKRHANDQIFHSERPCL